MSPVIEGCKLRPYGEQYMIDAYLGLIDYLLTESAVLDDFKERTGHNLKDIASARGINAMIDEASGRSKAAMIAWCDYVTEWHWGIEGQEPPDDLEGTAS